jgi:hypothetical protein
MSRLDGKVDGNCELDQHGVRPAMHKQSSLDISMVFYLGARADSVEVQSRVNNGHGGCEKTQASTGLAAGSSDLACTDKHKTYRKKAL